MIGWPMSGFSDMGFIYDSRSTVMRVSATFANGEVSHNRSVTDTYDYDGGWPSHSPSPQPGVPHPSAASSPHGGIPPPSIEESSCSLTPDPRSLFLHSYSRG